MKKSILVHGGWCVAVLGSFVLGAQVFPSGSKSSEKQGVDDKKSSARIGNGESAGSDAGSHADPESSPRPASGQPNSDDETAALSEEEISALGQQFKSAGSPIDRRLAFSRLLEGLTNENALLIRKQIEHVAHRSAEFREFHYAWGAVGGTTAIMFGADTPGPDMAPALSGWASKDTHAAIKWFHSLDLNDPAFDNLMKERKIPPEELRDYLMGGLMQGLADSSPVTAWNYLLNSSEGGNISERHINIVLDTVFRGGSPEEAAAYSQTLPEGTMRSNALRRTAELFANKDPAAAAEWATTLADQPEGSRVVREVGTRWSYREPEAAVRWLDDLPVSEGRSQALGFAVASWAGRNPEAAGDYINQMAPSPARDSAISGFANRIVHEDPESGVQWASSVDDPAARERALIRTGQVYFRRNAAEARAWLTTSGLPPEAQQQIISPPPRSDRDRRQRP